MPLWLAAVRGSASLFVPRLGLTGLTVVRFGARARGISLRDARLTWLPKDTRLQTSLQCGSGGVVRRDSRVECRKSTAFIMLTLEPFSVLFENIVFYFVCLDIYLVLIVLK